jgi:hypothetical protein
MWHECGRRGTRIGCWWEIQSEGVHKEDQDVGGWMVGRGDVDWIGLAQDLELMPTC